MKQRVPAKMVLVCDICHRQDGYLTKCLVCGREYCLLCRGIISGCMIMPDICRECDDKPEVKTLVDKYADKIVPIVRQRDAALKRLGEKTSQESKP